MSERKVPTWAKIALAIVTILFVCGGCSLFVWTRVIAPQPPGEATPVTFTQAEVELTLTAVAKPDLTVYGTPTPLPSIAEQLVHSNVNVPGTYQHFLDCQDWDPACQWTWMSGPNTDGDYSLSVTVPTIGSYEFKIALNGNWKENYGGVAALGVQDGDNVWFATTSPNQTVTFYWNEKSKALWSDAGSTASAQIVVAGAPTQEVGLEATPVVTDALTPLTPAQKCAWLSENWPQTPAGVQAKVAEMANVPTERVAPTLFDCLDGSDRYAGAIVLGPNEGTWTTTFTVNVPLYGVVDANDSSAFTGTLVVDLTGRTRRAYDGSVNSDRVTIWAWDDDRVVQLLALQQQSGGGASLLPDRIANNLVGNTALLAGAPADKAVWRTMVESLGTYVSGPDQYGGIVIVVKSNVSLPQGWEANTSAGQISATAAARTLIASETVTVYPPSDWRDTLGFSK